MATEVIEMYVRLLDEGTAVCRPTTAEVLRPGIVRLQAPANYDPATEQWEFPPGSVVSFEFTNGYVGDVIRRVPIASRLITSE